MYYYFIAYMKQAKRKRILNVIHIYFNLRILYILNKILLYNKLF